MVVHVGDSYLVANVKSGPRGLDAAPGAIRLLAGILQLFSETLDQRVMFYVRKNNALLNALRGASGSYISLPLCC